jgi:hypothetical protein
VCVDRGEVTCGKRREAAMGPRAAQERGRTTLATSPYKLTIAWCEYIDDSKLPPVTTEMKNFAGVLVWSWLFSSDPPCPAQS